jgi:hypothetical protein
LTVTAIVLSARRPAHLQGTIGYAEPARRIPQIAVLNLHRNAGGGVGGGLTDFL